MKFGPITASSDTFGRQLGHTDPGTQHPRTTPRLIVATILNAVHYERGSE
jgi:hypothetical protein